MSILLTKVRVPQRRKDVLRRVRLIDSLHQNLHRKLNFVSAPAGFGKTTLLSDFASDVVAKVCWYQISPQDDDLIPFLSHVIAAFQEQYPDLGHELIESLGVGGAPDPYSMATEIINQIETHVDDFTVFVLDDYHLVGESDGVVAFIESLLEFLPDQVRLVMGSRSVYGIPTANLYVREELGTLSADELRFRADELQALVHQNYHVKLSDEQANELSERADGWILAMLLAIRTMEHGALPKFEGALDQIYEFLAKDVIDRQPEELREFMLATSIVDEFDQALCEFMLESNDVERLLNELENRNLFVARVQTKDGSSFRYHQLFAEFLRTQLKQEDSKKEKKLHERAAQWYYQYETWELAVRHMLNAGKRKKAAAWIDEVASDYYINGHYNLLSSWYDSLLSPTDIRSSSPNLLLSQARVLMNQVQYEEAEGLLEISESIYQKEGKSILIASSNVSKAKVKQLRGDYQSAVEITSSTQEFLSHSTPSKENDYSWHSAERVKGYSLFQLSDLEGAIQHLENAVEFFRRELQNENNESLSRILFDLADTLSDLGVVYYSSANIFEAQKCFGEALDIHRKIKSNRANLALALNNVGFLLNEIGHYHDAWFSYEEALEIIQSTKIWRVMVLVLNSRGALLLDIHELDEAERTYRQAISIGEREGLQSFLYASFDGLSTIERLRGDFSEANYWLREMARVSNASLDEPGYQMRVGWIYLDMGQFDLACEAFKAALMKWGDDTRPSKDQALASFLLGRTLIELDKTAEASKFLDRSFSWAAQIGYDQFLVIAARNNLEYLKEMEIAKPNSQRASLVKRANEFQTGITSIQKVSNVTNPLKMHLEIQAFNVSRVRRNGELLANSEWRSNGARALFFYIVDNKGIRKDDVALEFWPEFSASKVSSNFHATLWRVRRALGNKDAIVYEGGLYILNPEIAIWYDVEEFESIVKKAQVDSLPESERATLWRSAIDLAQGDFLEDLFMDWSDERRAQLQETLIMAMREVAHWDFSQNRFEDARTLYERILLIDPYQDQIHLDLMKCLVAIGSATAAKAHFISYKELLTDELQAEPLEELRLYYEKIA